jgi:EmrB/QacA subfamily drug resistance transporter
MLIPLIVACALFMENLDSAIVATSMPAIAHDLGLDPVALKLAFTSYLLSIAVFTPISGWCADRFGARTVFRTAIFVFTAGSILCALSDTLHGFVLARIVQGLGGSMMMPVGRLVLLKSVEKRDYIKALSWLTIPGLFGPIMGPPVGGFITTFFDWRLIFWINVPIGCLGFVLVSIYISNIKESVIRPLDKLGFLLSGVGLGGFVFGIAASGVGLLPEPVILAMISIGATSIVAYFFHYRRTPYPLIDLKLFRIQTFRAGLGGGFLFRLGIGAIPFLLPLMLQVGFGLSAFESGMITFTSAGGALLMKAAAPPILRRYGFRSVLVFNALISSVLLAANGLFTPGTPTMLISAVLLFGGFFRSLQFTAFNVISFSDLSPAQMSTGTSLSAISQQVAIASGIAIGAGVLEVTRAGRDSAALVASDFTPAFFILAVISALSTLVVMRLPKNAGAEMSGHLAKKGPDASD